MRAVIQRVSRAEVRVLEGEGWRTSGQIGKGLLVLLGIAPEDGDKELDWLEDKIKNLRIFADEAGKMNLSVQDTQGQILLVSQFTLYGDASRGRRPSFIRAARPELAEPLYQKLAARLGAETGVFGAHMEVALVNDGPVTLLLDTP
jgi:D-tyrosyl-tRNA(Tyr) deacylase